MFESDEEEIRETLIQAYLDLLRIDEDHSDASKLTEVIHGLTDWDEEPNTRETDEQHRNAYRDAYGFAAYDGRECSVPAGVEWLSDDLVVRTAEAMRMADDIQSRILQTVGEMMKKEKKNGLA